MKLSECRDEDNFSILNLQVLPHQPQVHLLWNDRVPPLPWLWTHTFHHQVVLPPLVRRMCLCSHSVKWPWSARECVKSKKIRWEKVMIKCSTTSFLVILSNSTPYKLGVLLLWLVVGYLTLFSELDKWFVKYCHNFYLHGSSTFTTQFILALKFFFYLIDFSNFVDTSIYIAFDMIHSFFFFSYTTFTNNDHYYPVQLSAVLSMVPFLTIFLLLNLPLRTGGSPSEGLQRIASTDWPSWWHVH